MPKLSFNKACKLQSPEFKKVYAQGKKIHTKDLVAYVLASEQAKIGISVAKKKLKKANQRNKFKRMCRESFRLRQHDIAPCWLIICGKKGIQSATEHELKSQLEQIWQKTSWLNIFNPNYAPIKTVIYVPRPYTTSSTYPATHNLHYVPRHTQTPLSAAPYNLLYVPRHKTSSACRATQPTLRAAACPRHQWIPHQSIFYKIESKITALTYL